MLSFTPTAPNATTTPTFAPDGLTAHTIVKAGAAALAAGDIASGVAAILKYDATGTRWELQNPQTSPLSGLPTCSDSGGSHLNYTGTNFVCGNTTGGYQRAKISWGPGTIVDGGYTTNTILLSNATLGQGIVAGLPVLPAGVFAAMAVTSSGVVTITVINLSGTSQSISTSYWTAEAIN